MLAGIDSSRERIEDLIIPGKQRPLVDVVIPLFDGRIRLGVNYQVFMHRGDCITYSKLQVPWGVGGSYASLL